MSPSRVKARSWPSIVAFYRSIPWAGPLADLAEAIAGSEQGRQLFALTSMHDLIISQSPEFDWEVDVLRISPVLVSSDPFVFRLAFEYAEWLYEPRRWKRECAVEDGFALFQHFLRLQHWFVEYRDVDGRPLAR